MAFSSGWDDNDMKNYNHMEMTRVRIESLFEAIKHGDEKHQTWLKQAIEDHFAGRPVNSPERTSREGG